MGFFHNLKGEPAQPAPAVPPPPAAKAKVPKPPIDQELVDLVNAELPKKPKGKLNAAAFNVYRDLGPGRTYTEVGKVYKVTPSAVARYAVRHSWEARLHNESPERAAKVQAAVAVRVSQRLPALIAADSKDAEQARRVKNEVLEVGTELVALGVEALKSINLTEPKDVLRAIDLGQKMMLASVEGEKSDGEVLVDMMRAKLAALQSPEPKEADFKVREEKPHG